MLFSKRSFQNILFSVLLLSGSAVFAQRDTTFWFAAPDINSSSNLDRPVYLRITALGKAASVTISQPANSGFTTVSGSVSPNSTLSIDFTSVINQVENSGADVITNKGLLIKSTAKILAVWEPSARNNPDIFALKGRNALGTDFIVTAQRAFWSYSDSPSSFYVVATEDGTTITITPSEDLVGHPKASGAYTKNLNKGQVYVGDAVNFDTRNVGGTIVTSNKPVAITMANDLTATGICGDLNGDQLVPTTLAGDKFITLPGGLSTTDLGGTISDLVYVYPKENNTQITVNGTVVATKNRGQYYELQNANNVNYITTDKPALVYQLSGFGCEVGGAVVPGLDCTGSTTVGITRSSDEAFTVLLLVKAGKEGNFTLNGSSSVITAGSFSNVPSSNGEWKWAKLNLNATVGSGATAIISNKYPFHAGVINGGATGGTRYGYFSNFGGFEPDIFLTPDTFGDFYTTIDGTAYRWLKDGVAVSGATAQTYTAAAGGKYQVEVTYDANCPPGLSEPIKVALTPANIGTYPALWLRADQGVTVSGGAVTDWLDTSGENNHHTQASSTNRPGFDDKIANFNPTVTYNGNQWIADNNGILEAGVDYNSAQLFIVHNSEPVTDRALYGQYVYINGTTMPARYMGHGEFYGYQYFGIRSNADFNGNDWVLLPNGPERLNAYVINTFGVNTAGKQQLWFNGGEKYEAPLGGSTYRAVQGVPWVTGAGPVGSNTNSNPDGFRQKGQISELIVFTEELPEYKRQRIETYLGIKYGSQVLHDYFNFNYDGTNAATTTVYHASTYGNNIAGIARDDKGAFYQKQGRSQNSVQYARLLTMGVGEIAASNALNTNTLVDGTYLVWGDDGKSPAEVNNDPAAASAKLLGRTWKIQVKGTSPANVTVNFNLTGVTTSATNISDIRLAVNRYGIADFSSPEVVEYYEPDPSSTLTNVTFNNVKWDSDGSGQDVFTLQTKSLPCQVPYIPAVSKVAVDPCVGPVNLSVGGAALDLDGNFLSHAEIPNVLNGAPNFTFETWVFYRGGGTWARIIDFAYNSNEYMAITVKGNGVGANGVGSASYSDLPLLTFSNSGSGPQEQRVVSSVPFPLNVWTHLAVTIEGNVGKIYLNGVLVGVNNNLTLTLAAIRPTTANYIGRSQYPADPYLNAKLDEMRFWTVARTQTDIIKGMKVRYQQDYPNLVGYYPFDEGSGTKIYDKSVNRAEGTITRLSGSPWEFPSTSPSGSFKTYNWSTGATTSGISVATTGTYLVGTYTVAVEDVRGCTAEVPTDVVIGAPTPALTLDGPSTFCYGVGVNVTSSASQGLTWFKNGIAAPALTGQTVHVLDSGTYTVKSTLNGCNSDPSADLVVKINLGCDQDGDGVTDGNEFKDGTEYNVFCSFKLSSQTLQPSVDWKTADCDKDGNNNSTDPNTNTPTAVDDNVGILEADFAKFNVLTNDDFLAGNQISIQRTGGTAKGTEVIDQETGEITYRSAPGEVGTVTLIYTVCNTAVTPEVCAEATVTIDITIAELKIPQGFSPNGNSKNDKWVINGLEAYPENSLKVFNRWGNEVYSAAPYKYSWDGTSISGGRVPAGTYYYVLDLGNGQRKTGYVFVAY